MTTEIQNHNFSLFYVLVTVVEDAGLSWLRKSYQRMKEQAEREKRNVEEIVAERYGVRFFNYYYFFILVDALKRSLSYEGTCT